MHTHTKSSALAWLLILCFSGSSGIQSSKNDADAETNKPAQPNIILILTDDQDMELGSLNAMPKLKRIIKDNGAFFPNMFVTTPICCPSRATIFSGRYIHSNRVYNNSVNGGCNDAYWRDVMEPTAFPALLKKAGYKTFYSGKYLNQYGSDDGGGGPEHIPEGFDWWGGLIGLPYYYKCKMSINGTKIHLGTKPEDYLTNVIRSQAREFLKTARKDEPFFMVLAATAPHTPGTTVPPYKHKFAGEKAPRTPHYAKYSPDKHWIVRHMPKDMPRGAKKEIDKIYRHRLRSLQPVDDMVAEVYETVRKMGVADDTYIIYTSDNGFHLGQFNLLWQKRHLYEFDVRVPLLIRGPKVPARLTVNQPVLNLDLAPTILSMAGITLPDYFEGKSMMPLLTSDLFPPNWRKSFLIEYYGEAKFGEHQECRNGFNGCLYKCICIDTRNNTFDCVRSLDSTVDIGQNDMFCQLKDQDGFIEYYDLRKDKYQLENQAKTLSSAEIERFKKQVAELKSCSGSQCRALK